MQPLPQSFSIMCDLCETILEYQTGGAVRKFTYEHPHKCEEGNRIGPLHNAYNQYLEQLTPEQHMTHTTEQIKHALRKTLD